MSQQPSSTDNLSPHDRAAIERCFDAYGADVDKWPQDARRRYGDVAASEGMALVRADAESLDGFLNAATHPRAAADLQSRILADYAAPRPALSLWEGLAGWVSHHMRLVPAGAVAAIGALGLATGVLTAESQASLTPEYEAYAYLQDSLAPSLINEEGSSLWDGE